MTDEIRVPVKCDNCGQVDDHPKLNYGELTFHHDCTPAFVLEDMVSVSDWVWDPFSQSKVLLRRDPIPEDSLHPQIKQFLRLREAALGGIHGDELKVAANRMASKYKPHEDVEGADRHILAVTEILMQQEAQRPAHLRAPVQE